MLLNKRRTHPQQTVQNTLFHPLTHHVLYPRSISHRVNKWLSVPLPQSIAIARRSPTSHDYWVLPERSSVTAQEHQMWRGKEPPQSVVSLLREAKKNVTRKSTEAREVEDGVGSEGREEATRAVRIWRVQRSAITMGERAQAWCKKKKLDPQAQASQGHGLGVVLGRVTNHRSP
jgi:hypothetical protein